MPEETRRAVFQIYRPILGDLLNVKVLSMNYVLESDTIEILVESDKLSVSRPKEGEMLPRIRADLERLSDGRTTIHPLVSRNGGEKNV